MKKLLALLTAVFVTTAAYGQNAGTVTNHAFAIGKGANVTGYTSLLCSSGQIAIGSAADPVCRTVSGDGAISAAGVLTLSTVNANVGSFGSATQAGTFTVNAKGLVTAASSVTVTPAVGSITGLGAGVATALRVAANGSGGFIGPTPTRAGDVPYWNGSAWTSLAGNNSGTGCFQENASGVPSFGACGGGGGTPGGSSGQTQYNNAGAFGGYTMGGDATIVASTGVLTLATVNANVGTFGSATQAGTFTVNAKGLITAASGTTVTPAVGSITGLGAGVATALGVNIGSAGAPVLFNGAGGTPTSLVGTNITGTASGLTAGTVTTNANLTGDVTSVGNATTYNNIVPVAKGGTGIASGTSGGVLYYSASGTIASSGQLAVNTLTAGGGAGAAPKNSGLAVSGSDLSSLVASSVVASLPQFVLTNNVADAGPASFLFKKNRAAADTTTNDGFLDIQGYGWANSAQNIGGRWQMLQAAASSGSNIPTKQVWSNSNAAGLINQTMTFDSAAHLSFGQATAPTVSAGCNGAGSSVTGTDFAGTVTGQTAAATTCTVTFGTAFAATPHCIAVGLTSPLTGAITPATGTLVVNFASTANFKFTYHCAGA